MLVRYCTSTEGYCPLKPPLPCPCTCESGGELAQDRKSSTKRRRVSVNAPGSDESQSWSRALLYIHPSGFVPLPDAPSFVPSTIPLFSPSPVASSLDGVDPPAVAFMGPGS